MKQGGFRHTVQFFPAVPESDTNSGKAEFLPANILIYY